MLAKHKQWYNQRQVIGFKTRLTEWNILLCDVQVSTNSWRVPSIYGWKDLLEAEAFLKALWKLRILEEVNDTDNYLKLFPNTSDYLRESTKVFVWKRNERAMETGVVGQSEEGAGILIFSERWKIISDGERLWRPFRVKIRTFALEREKREPIGGHWKRMIWPKQWVRRMIPSGSNSGWIWTGHDCIC